MAIDRVSIKLLMEEGRRKPFFGRILTAGKQNILSSELALRDFAHEMKFLLTEPRPTFFCQSSSPKHSNNVSDQVFFELLGFDAVDSIDYSCYEQCTIVHDLNHEVPESLHQKYDMILDSGTSEHIFNLPKVLQNYFNMLKVGGRIIHIAPIANWVDHGFYCFSPRLFFDYYSANKYHIISALIRSISHMGRTCKVYEWEPSKSGHLMYDAFTNPWLIHFVAEKSEESTFDAVVQQGSYLEAWNNLSSAPTEYGMARRNVTIGIDCLYRKLRPRLPLAIKHIGRSLSRAVRLGRPRLKLVGKY